MIHNKIGETRWKLADMLREKGIEVYAGDLESNREGQNNPFGEIRWDAYGKHKGKRKRVYSWDTMTELVRRGFVVDEDGHEICVHVSERSESKKSLVCSRGHVWKTDTVGDRFTHGDKKAGDRCPMVMAYDRMSGTTYCRRILKPEQKEAKK